MTNAIWTPNAGGQLDFVSDLEHRYIALEGGWYSGKTFIAARKLVALHLTNNSNALVPSAAVAPTYGNAADFVIPELISAIEECGLECSYHTKSNSIRFDSIRCAPIMIRTADRPERITGWSVGAFWGDEASRWRENRSEPKLDAILQLTGRLRHKKARRLQGLFSFTPEGDTTFIHEFFHEGEHDDRALYRCPTSQNPTAADFVEAQRSVLSDELAAQYLEGVPVSLRGKRAYSAFDADRHVADCELDPALPVCFTIDFNTVPGCHAFLAQFDEERDHIIVRHEFHRRGMDVDDAVDAACAVFGDEFEFPSLEVHGDAAGHPYSAFTAITNRLMQRGIPRQMIRVRAKNVNPPVQRRIHALNAALSDSSGDVHLTVHPSCKALTADLRLCKWDKSGTGLDKSDPARTHASDAMGYFVDRVRPIRVALNKPQGRWRFD